MALENLYLLLLRLSNRGINLWCIEKIFLGLNNGQAVYPLPVGTLDLVDVAFSQPTQLSVTTATTSTSITWSASTATQAVRVGAIFSTLVATDTLTIQYSTDGVSWNTVQTYAPQNLQTNLWYWFDIQPSVSALKWRITTTQSMVVSDSYVASGISDLPITPWNRDTYAAMNNKFQPGIPCTNYLLDRFNIPQLTVWPVPNASYYHLTIWRHRQIQDIGTLTQTIDVPERWKDSIIWQLALAIFSEVDVEDLGDPKRLPYIQSMADSTTQEVESDETDGAPITLAPRIGVYTR